MAKVFCVPDAHFPFHSSPALTRVISLIKRENPDAVVQLGDLYDLYFASKYPRSHNVATPQQELHRAVKAARKMWEDIQTAAPKAKCYQLWGNHDDRLLKRVHEKFPEGESLVKMGKLYKFAGVQSTKSGRDHLELDGVAYVHGWLSKSIDHAVHFNMPTVHGHRHRPAIEIKGPRLWSMDCGYIADQEQLPLQYGPSRVTTWRLACGVVEDGQPRLIFL